MNKKWLTLIPYLLLVGIGLFAFNLYLQTEEQTEALADLRAGTQTQAEERRALLAELLAIDTLAFRGEISEARQAYQALARQSKPTGSLHSIIQARIEQLDSFAAVQAQVQALQQLPSQQELAGYQRQVDSLLSKLRQVGQQNKKEADSLRFLLQKASTRINVLSGQITLQSRVGYLTFTNEEGTRIDYVGEIEEDKAFGQGVGLYQNGNRYEGEWKNNQRHGEGLFVWPDGESYQGEFRQDKRQGKGTYHWPNGESFTGSWANDQRNGPGTFYDEEGNPMVSGIWKKNKLVEKNKER